MTNAVSIAQSGSNNVTFRNRIINGAMIIDQRNAGASVTPTTSGYTLDRWKAGITQSSKFSVQQVTTAPAGYNNSLKVTSLATTTVGSGDYYAIIQSIEGYNFSDLAFGTASAKSFTLSFWVQSSLTGTFGGGLTSSGDNDCYPFTYTISSANTWTQISVNVSGNTGGTWLTTNGIGLNVYFGLGVGSSYSGTVGTWSGNTYKVGTSTGVSVVGTSGATWYVTGVQLEVGTQATSFDFRSIGTELILCQRYYENSYEYGTAVGSSVSASYQTFAIATYYSGSGNGWSGTFCFKVQKRTTPTVTFYNRGGTSGQWYWGITGFNEASVATYTNNVNSYNFAVVGASVNANSTSAAGFYIVSSEL